MIRVLFFASLRERLGIEAEELDDFPSTVGALCEQLAGRGGPWHEIFAADRAVLCAINQEMAAEESEITDGDEVGFFPPVTGG